MCTSKVEVLEVDRSAGNGSEMFTRARLAIRCGNRGFAIIRPSASAQGPPLLRVRAQGLPVLLLHGHRFGTFLQHSDGYTRCSVQHRHAENARHGRVLKPFELNLCRKNDGPFDGHVRVEPERRGRRGLQGRRKEELLQVERRECRGLLAVDVLQSVRQVKGSKGGADEPASEKGTR